MNGNGPSVALPAFDRDRLRSFTNGDAALEAELVGLFTRTAGEYVQRLERALHADAAVKFDQWQAAAHALKGASANIGAMEVNRLARVAEAEGPSPTRVVDLGRALAAARAYR